MIRLSATILSALVAFCPFAVAQPTNAEPVEVSTFAVDLRPREPDEVRVGSLRYLGGIVLRSSDRQFSGISGLRFASDGVQLLGVSDRGVWVSFEPEFEDGRLAGIRAPHVWPMLDQDGAPLENPRYDAESLTWVGEVAYVGFEREHRIDTYISPLSADNPHPEQFLGPEAFGTRENNGGLEGLVNLDGGRLLAIVEAPNDDSTFDGWLIGPDGTMEELALFAQEPYRLTDLAALPSGDVITLERRFSPIGGVGARMRLIPADRIAPGVLLDGEVIAELGAGYTVDNMEGIAVRQIEDRTEIFTISDDNQNPFQRTILMAFELVE